MKKKIVIIGSGPGGYTAALKAAELGGDVTLIEKDKIGGVCLNRGCIPSKIMKHTADLLEGCRRGEEFGIRGAEDAVLDMAALLARKRKVITDQQKAINALLAKAGVCQLTGEATLKKHGLLSVGLPSGNVQEVAWDKLIIATGSTPIALPQLPFNGKTILSSDDLVWITNLPESLVVVGGGVVGCEFAFMMASFGVKVSLVEGMARVLPLASVDHECSKVLQRQMKKTGISLFLNSIVSKVTCPSGEAEVIIESKGGGSVSPGKENSVTADAVLVCVGRKANMEGVGLEKSGIRCDFQGWIEVDEQLQTSHKGVYAVGDILGPDHVMLAHVAVREGKIAAGNCLQGATEKMLYQHIPTTIFSRPEIGCVGITEQVARERGIEIICQNVLFRTCPKPHIIGEIDGMVKVVAEKENGEIIGVHIIGPHASDLIAEGVLAISKKCTIRELVDLIHAHPTLAEIMGELAMSNEQLAISN